MYRYAIYIMRVINVYYVRAWVTNLQCQLLTILISKNVGKNFRLKVFCIFNKLAVCSLSLY